MRLAILPFFLGAAAAQAPPAEPSMPAPGALDYKVEWRLFDAGRAHIEWKPADKGHEIKLRLEATGLVSKLYKVDDLYTVQVAPGLCTTNSHLMAIEGSRHRETTVHFDSETGKASYLEKDLKKNGQTVEAKEIEIPACVHDVITALFRLRAMQLEPGQHVTLPISDGKKSVSARIEAQERETVKAGGVQYKTVRYEAFLFNNVLYRRNARLFVWLTDDARRLPVQIRVRMQFTIGTITLTLAPPPKS